jgi:hypothetical protein
LDKSIHLYKAADVRAPGDNGAVIAPAESTEDPDWKEGLEISAIPKTTERWNDTSSIQEI